MNHWEDLGVEPPERLAARLERMLAAGRITSDEAHRVRCATDDTERTAALMAIRLRHARARVHGALAEGRMTGSEADDVLRQLASGDDPRQVRRQLHGLTDRIGTAVDAPNDEPQ